MEELRIKTKNDQERKKMVVKMGGGSVGGIGAVVLLGGALATAALTSAFIFRKRGRSSTKDRHRRRRQSPPPEINKQQNEQDKQKGQHFNSLDQPADVENHPSGAAKEAESQNDTGLLVSTESRILEEKPRVEIIGGTPGDVCDAEAYEEIICSNSPRKLEKDAISDGSVIVQEGFASLDEKSPFDFEVVMHEDEVKIQSTKEDIYNEISKEIQNIEIEEERAEGEPSDGGEIKGTNHKEAVEATVLQPRQEENSEICYDQEEIEVTIVDNAVEEVHTEEKERPRNVSMKVRMEDNGEINEEKAQEDNEKTEKDVNAVGSELCEDGICGNQEAISTGGSLSEIIVPESRREDGQKTLLPMFDSKVVEQVNVNGYEKLEAVLPTEIVEIIQEDEAIEVSQEDEVNHSEEQLIKEQENFDQPDEGIVSEKCEEVGWTDEANQSNLQIEMGEKRIHSKNKEENACIGNPAPETRQFRMPMLREEMVSSKEIEGKKEDGADEEVAESLDVNEDKISDREDDSKRNIAELEEELISPENFEVTKEDGGNDEVAESLELNENKNSTQFAVCQPKDREDDLEKRTAKEVKEELVSPEKLEVTKEDGANEEVEDSSETTETGIATTKDDLVVGMREDEEKGENIKEFDDETNSSDEVEESSVGTGDSSVESNSEAVWPAEALQESSKEPGKVKFVDGEVGGKIQEDTIVKEVDKDSEDSQINGGEDSSVEPHKEKADEKNSQKSGANLLTVADSSQFPYGNGDSEKTFIKKYVAAMLKDHPINSTGWRMLIFGVLSVLSSLSCSWLFGLSFVKLCLIVFLTVVLSKIHGY